MLKKTIKLIIDYHWRHHEEVTVITPIQKAKMDSSISDSSLLEKLFQVQCCDGLAHNPTKLEKRRKYLEEAYHYLHPNAPEDRVRTWVNKTPGSSKILEKRR